jgi:hypothetical protein
MKILQEEERLYQPAVESSEKALRKMENVFTLDQQSPDGAPQHRGATCQKPEYPGRFSEDSLRTAHRKPAGLELKGESRSPRWPHGSV